MTIPQKVPNPPTETILFADRCQDELAKQMMAQAIKDGQSPKTPRIRRATGSAVDDRRPTVIRALKQSGPMTIAQITDMVDLKRTAVRDTVLRLCEMGEIKRVNSGRFSMYALLEQNAGSVGFVPGSTAFRICAILHRHGPMTSAKAAEYLDEDQMYIGQVLSNGYRRKRFTRTGCRRAYVYGVIE